MCGSVCILKGCMCALDFVQVLLSKVLYEGCMTFLPECGADKSISSLTVISPPICGFIMIPCMSDLVE